MHTRFVAAFERSKAVKDVCRESPHSTGSHTVHEDKVHIKLLDKHKTQTDRPHLLLLKITTGDLAESRTRGRADAAG